MYATAADAIQMIIATLENSDGVTSPEDEFDIDAIFEENFEFSPELQQFVQITSTDEYWKSVERHAVEA